MHSCRLVRGNPRTSETSGRVEGRNSSRPTVSPGRCVISRRPEQHPRGEGGAVEGVVADRQGLPGCSEDHLLVRDQPADPETVHVDAVDLGATGTVELGRGRVRAPGPSPPPAARPRRAAPYGGRCRRGRRPCPGGAAPRSPPTRRSGRPRWRSASSAPPRSRSSRRPGRRSPRCQPSQPRSRSRRASSNPVVPTTAWIPWPHAELEVVHRHVGVGEVDDRLDPARDQLLERGRRPRRSPATRVHVLGSLDRRTHLATDLAQRAQHAHLESTHADEASCCPCHPERRTRCRRRRARLGGRVPTRRRRRRPGRGRAGRAWQDRPTWVFTVASPRKSAAAISGWTGHGATSRSTSVSRSVRPVSARDGPASGGAASTNAR